MSFSYPVAPPPPPLPTPPRCVQHFPTLVRCLEAWADTPEVSTPVLKFMCEFAFNKSQRLTFDSSSPNGILLFRCVCGVGGGGAAGRS